jgi:hypothetical protein
VVRPRRGLTSLGCLFMMLLAAAVVYFGVGVGEHYMAFYQFQDAMRQEVKFAAHNSDALILRHLRERADSLELPEAAGEVSLQRAGRHIELESEYYVHLELPLYIKEVRLNPHAEGIF